MIKQPDTDMLIHSMKKMEEYGIPGLDSPDQKRVGLLKAPGRNEVRSEEVTPDIMFVNQAYDSRKTGINDSAYSPSVYRLYPGSEFLSFTCNKINTQPHRHFAIQLAFNFEAPFILSMAESEKFGLFFFIIPTDIPHQFSSPAGKHISILVDPLSLLGRRLRLLFEDQDSFTAFNRSVIDKVYPYIQTRLPEFETVHFLNNIIACLSHMISELPGYPMDERIRQAITHCRIKGGRELHTSDLAGWTSLSKSRARHLFKEQTGVSFKRYLKWLKTMEAVKYACTANSNLTEAAHMAGFSDSAHLSRTFKEMFGLSPSSIFK
jgi:AraC-like DNA-binding protein